MASPIGRVSALWSVGLSLGAALAFFGAARWAGEAARTAAMGGSVWVFLLALIVSMPLVTGWVKRQSARGSPGARRPWRDRTAMELTAAIWVCTLPFVFLLLSPWLGFKAMLTVALAWAVVMALACWILCTTRRAWSHNQGGTQ